MKAASSEWYTTTSRHALPLPLSPSSSAASTSRRDHRNRALHGYALDRPRNEFSSSRYSGTYDGSSSFRTISTDSKTYSTGHQSTLSFSKGESARGTGESSESGSRVDYGGRRRSKSKSTTPALPSFSSTSSSYYTTRNSDKYKDRILYPPQSTYSYDTRLPSFAPSNLSNRFSESEFSEISRIFGATEVEVSATEGEASATEEEEGYPSYTAEEAGSEEEENDENVYKSFKESLMMLHPEPRLFRKSPSVSPALSLRSVITELEEDEEDLPPEQVEEELHSTTEDDYDGEEEEEEEEIRRRGVVSSTSSGPFSRSYLRHVPKSPVKVRVKVEKATPDKDDKVKVTVHFEDEYQSEEEDEEVSATTSTAETVRSNRSDRERTHSSELTGSEYDDDEGSLSQHSSEQSDSENNSLSEEENESERSIHDKTDSHNILTTSPAQRLESSPGDRSSAGTHSKPVSFGPSTSHSSTTLSHTTNSKDDSEKKVTESGTSGTEQRSTNSSNSSRSHSARSSPIGRHKMYLVGDKIRSLSARTRAFPPLIRTPIRQNTYTLHSLHEDESIEHPSFLTKTGSTSSNSDNEYNKPFPKLSRYATYLLPDKTGMSDLPPIPTRCHSASFSRNRQFSAALAQLSQGHNTPNEMREDDFQGLPPITLKPSTESTTSSSSGSLPKPRPLLRNLTYTVCSHSTEEESCPPTDLSYMRRLSEMEHASTEFSSEIENKHLLFSEQVPFDSVYSIGNLDQQRFNDLIALSSVNKEHQESFLFPPLNWKSQTYETSDSAFITESLLSHSNKNSASSSASSSGRKAIKVEFDEEKSREDLINKDCLTYGELMKESVDEPGSTNERLRRFALAKIRKQIELERKRLQSIELEGSGDDRSANEDEDDDDDDEDDDEYESSEMDTERKRAALLKRHFRDETHIPMPSSSGNVPKEDSQSAQEALLDDPPMIINQTEEGASSWGQDMKKNFDEDEQAKEKEIILSPLNTRPASAESGYRAMPPSRATSRDFSREQSQDLEELEKEKDRLMKEWKNGGEEGPPPTTASIHSLAGSSSSTHPFPHFINTDESSFYGPNYTLPQEELRDDLIKGDIDLTKELPDEAKKIGAIWEEFNKDEREGAQMADYEFSTLLDEMVMDLNSYKPHITTGVNTSSSHSLQVSNKGVASPHEKPKFENRKYNSLSEMVSLLSHNLRLVSSETLEDHMASLISLISTTLKKVRKNKAEDDYQTQISCLSAIRVLCDRIQEMQSSQNLKYADLSWLFRILCKYSSDTESKIRPEASFCLARLVKVAGPALVVRPIYFILVMESEGGGGKTNTGAKTKAAAIDTLTYALLTFPPEEFHNLEEIAGWVCLAMLNEQRRIRQSSLECLSVIARHLGGREKAVPLFHTLFLKEEMDHFSRSPSPESVKTSKTGKSGKTNKSDPIPLSVHGTVRLLTGPGFPIAQPIDAITARLDKNVFPVPSTKGLIEYAVNVPTGKDLVLLMTHMLDKDDDEWDFSSSTDSLDSGRSLSSKRSSVGSIGFSDIDWEGDGAQKEKKGDENELISPDVAFILLGKGRVNKQEVVLLDTYKKEIIPEIIEMLNRKHQQGKGKKKRFAKLNKRRRRRRRKGYQNDGSDDEEGGHRRGPLIPTLSFECDDGDDKTLEETNSAENTLPTEETDEPPANTGPTVIIDPPPASDDLTTEESTNKS